MVISNALVPAASPSSTACNVTLGENTCMDKGCFLEGQRCDGKNDCPDGYDERDCVDEVGEFRAHHKRYLLSRQSRFEDFYDIGDGDWGWFDLNIDHDGEEFVTLELAETPDDFYFHIFSLSRDNGIGVLEVPAVYSTTRPVDFYCEGPPRLKRGESTGIICTILNRFGADLEASVVLRGSPDYAFIHVESYGYVVSYAPRTTHNQDVHHYVFVRGEDEREIRVPVAIKVQEGDVDITIDLSSQITFVSRTVTISVVPEGGHVQRHTSALLDLKNRANVYQFMNVIVDETPVVPYEVFRRYVAGSARGYVALSGDVVGPVFPGGEPVSLQTAFPTGNGRFAKGTDLHIFNLATNVWQLHYLRLTNQLSQSPGLLRRILSQVNNEYASVLRRFSAQGWIKNWDDSAPSVWLTALVLRFLSHASFQDWEDFLYIDPEVIASGVMWLLNYQTPDGAFLEFGHYRDRPLHLGMSPWKNATSSLALTAHVLITLEETTDMLKGDAVRHATMGRQRASAFLERSLPSADPDDGYAAALLAYALALAKSPAAGAAFRAMMAAAREEGGMIYWGRGAIATNRVRYEFNRPFLEAKDQQDGDALAVEATSYALLAIFLTEGGGITFTQEKIVEWLNSMRLGEGGFVSTVDTAVAMQALVTYSYHSRILDITDLSVNVDLPASNVSQVFKITGQSGIADPHRFDLPNVWGHLNLYAHGAGQAVAQLDVTYGVDYEPFKDRPPTDCFDLKVQERFGGRNKSEVTTEACFRWTNVGEAAASGMALLSVDTPSGYILEQRAALDVVRAGAVPEMVDADTLNPGKTVWYFDHVPNVTRCFSFTVKRYFPVANMTRTRQAVLMEPLRPERFVTRTFNATSLYILSICEVCGSFQCPYCPFYSSAPPGPPATAGWVLLSSLLISVVLTTLKK